MAEEYFEIVAKDGLALHAKKWIPDTPPKAIVCIVHGMFEHLERYNHVADYFTTQSIGTYAYDLRGHGKSSGKRGHAKKYDYLMDDIEEILIAARADYTDAPIFLMGHSFGGNQVASYMLKDKSKEIKGVILSSPWFRLAFEPSAAKLKLAKIMNKIYPAYVEKSDMDNAGISKDPKEVEAYDSDPLIHNKISAGLFTSIYAAGIRAIEKAHLLKTPMLHYHGDADSIISHEASAEFAKNAGDFVDFRLLKGVYHEPHNDLEKAEVLKMVTDWIEDQLSAK